MVTCPHCQQIVDSQAWRCPHCTKVLKAYGHVGIPLHQARGDTFLCDDCLYHQDDSCNFPQRPHAKSCTLYQNSAMILEDKPAPLPLSRRWRWWSWRNRGGLLLIGLILLSMAIALLSG